MTRLTVYPGVTAGHLCGALRSWLLKQKVGNIAICCADLIGLHFKLAPKRNTMVRYSGLCAEVIAYAKNGVISGPTLMAAVIDLQRLEPKLGGERKLSQSFLLKLSLGMRTVLSWYREYYKGGKVKLILVKGASDGQRRILEDVSSMLEIPKEKQVTAKKPKADDEVDEEEEATLEALVMEKAEETRQRRQKAALVTIKAQEASVTQTRTKVKADEAEVTKKKAEEERGPLVTQSKAKEAEVTKKKAEEERPLVTQSKAEEAALVTQKAEEAALVTQRAEEAALVTKKKAEEASLANKAEEGEALVLLAEEAGVRQKRKAEEEQRTMTPAKLPKFWHSFTATWKDLSPSLSSPSSSLSSLGPMSSNMPIPSNISMSATSLGPVASTMHLSSSENGSAGLFFFTCSPKAMLKFTQGCPSFGLHAKL